MFYFNEFLSCFIQVLSKFLPSGFISNQVLTSFQQKSISMTSQRPGLHVVQEGLVKEVCPKLKQFQFPICYKVLPQVLVSFCQVLFQQVFIRFYFSRFLSCFIQVLSKFLPSFCQVLFQQVFIRFYFSRFLSCFIQVLSKFLPSGLIRNVSNVDSMTTCD